MVFLHSFLVATRATEPSVKSRHWLDFLVSLNQLRFRTNRTRKWIISRCRFRSVSEKRIAFLLSGDCRSTIEFSFVDQMSHDPFGWRCRWRSKQISFINTAALMRVLFWPLGRSDTRAFLLVLIGFLLLTRSCDTAHDCFPQKFNRCVASNKTNKIANSSQRFWRASSVFVRIACRCDSC